MKNANHDSVLICTILLLFLPHMYSYGQQDNISITAEVISVIRSDMFKPKCRNIYRKDTIPLVICFTFIVKKETNKNMIPGSNTRDYYRNQEYLYYSDS